MEKLQRSAIGLALAAKIRGKEEVEHLRKLVAGTATTEDLLNAISWADEQIRRECYEDWGAPDASGKWIAARTPALALTGELVILRANLNLLNRPPERDLSSTPHSTYPVPLPHGLEMYPFQRGAVEYAQGKNFVILADEMGLGKTLEAIGIVNCMPFPGRILVVCTATLKDNWKRELEKWSVHPLTINVVDSKDNDIPEADVTIINYDLVFRREIPGPYNTVICDEAHYLRSLSAQRTTAMLRHLADASLRIVITGTPIVNSPYDLWPVLSVSGLPLADGYLDRYVIEETRERPNGYGKTFKYIKRKGKNQEELQSLLRDQCMHRCLKKDVLPQLPEKTIQTIYLPGIRATYSEPLEDIEAQVRGVMDSGIEEKEGEHISTTRREQAIVKTPYALDHIHEILDGNDQKVVIFAHHHEVVKLLIDGLSKYSPIVITGETPPKIRGTLVAAFQEGESRVFIGSIYAAGEGITLTAASLVIFVELDWDATKIDQAEARLHRIGAKNPVVVQHLIMQDSIDHMILKAMVTKSNEALLTVG